LGGFSRDWNEVSEKDYEKIWTLERYHLTLIDRVFLLFAMEPASNKVLETYQVYLDCYEAMPEFCDLSWQRVVLTHLNAILPGGQKFKPSYDFKPFVKFVAGLILGGRVSPEMVKRHLNSSFIRSVVLHAFFSNTDLFPNQIGWLFECHKEITLADFNDIVNSECFDNYDLESKTYVLAVKQTFERKVLQKRAAPALEGMQQLCAL
jgi:hypothetical protein